MSDESKPIGTVLDALGVTCSLTADQQITEALCIVKIADFATGHTMLGLYASDGLDWIAQGGLLAAANQVSAAAEPFDGDDEDGN